MGEKPLLVYRDEDKLLFGSEMKSLLALGIPRKLDYVSPESLPAAQLHSRSGHHFQGREEGAARPLPVREGQEGGAQAVVQDSLRRQESREEQDSPTSSSRPSWCELLDDATARRLVADVPVGAFLSGGIDSSVVVALASRHTQHLNTFSIGFADEPFFDETKYAKLVAERYKTNHTVFSLTNQDLYDHIFDVLNYIDEPFADSSALAVYILSKRTREKATVALSGDGADELFAGYNKHMGEFQVRQGGFKAEAVTGLNLLWDVLPKSRNSFFGNKVRQFQRFSRGMLSGPKDRYWDWASLRLRKGRPRPAQRRLPPQSRQEAGRPTRRRDHPGRPARRRRPERGAAHRYQAGAALRHARQGGHDEHGQLPGGAPALPRPQRGRASPSRCPSAARLTRK